MTIKGYTTAQLEKVSEDIQKRVEERFGVLQRTPPARLCVESTKDASERIAVSSPKNVKSFGLKDYSSMVPQIEIPPSPLVENVADNYASEFCKRLMRAIHRFNQSIDDQHEIGARLVNFGQSVTLHLRELGYADPSLIVFFGETPGGDAVELIQHVSQISVLLTKVPRNQDTPKKEIGFHSIMSDDAHL